MGTRRYACGFRNRGAVSSMRWLVAYQVKGESVSSLAKRLGGGPEATRNTIWKALKRLEHDLPLPLRPAGPKGRKPRGQRGTASESVSSVGLDVAE